MKPWNLIQNQPLLNEIFKEPQMISFKRGKSLSRVCSSEQNYKGAKTEHVWSRITCQPEVENIEGYSAQQFLLIPQYYAGLKRVVSELSNDTKHDVVWREYRLQK